MDSPPRIDKYLWAIRLYKTRSEATEACRGGKVEVNGQPVKPSREVKVGDVIDVRNGSVRHRYQVLELLGHRVAAKDLAPYVLDTTPPEALAKGELRNETALVWRERGTGRPTKKDRRKLDKVLGYESL